MASCSSSASGRSLRGQAREIVYNVAKHLREQKELHNLMYNVVQSTSEATGISQSSVKRILAEARSHLAKGKLKFSTPTKKKSSNVTKIIVDDFTKCVIRRKIHDFYINKKTVPTLKKLNRLLKDEDILHCGREYLRKLLKSMGFKWKRCQSSRKILMEKPENVAWRARYLREIRQHRYNKRNIVYLDETYIHSTLSVPSCWQSETEIGSAKAVSYTHLDVYKRQAQWLTSNFTVDEIMTILPPNIKISRSSLHNMLLEDTSSFKTVWKMGAALIV